MLLAVCISNVCLLSFSYSCSHLPPLYCISLLYFFWSLIFLFAFLFSSLANIFCLSNLPFHMPSNSFILSPLSLSIPLHPLPLFPAPFISCQLKSIMLLAHFFVEIVCFSIIFPHCHSPSFPFTTLLSSSSFCVKYLLLRPVSTLSFTCSVFSHFYSLFTSTDLTFF